MKLVLIACLVVSAYATIPDNCEDGPDSGCDIGGQCVSLGAGVSRCTCFQGYMRSTITSKCIDVDECKSTTSWLCQYGYCRNLVGTYRCVCSQQYGYIVTPDGKACIRRVQAVPYPVNRYPVNRYPGMRYPGMMPRPSPYMMMSMMDK